MKVEAVSIEVFNRELPQTPSEHAEIVVSAVDEMIKSVKTSFIETYRK